MRIVIDERIEIVASRERVFDHTNDAASMTSFVGYGPIPGIREARYLTAGPPALGSKRTVLKTDGTSHLEEITVFERPARHVTRITGLSGLFRVIVRGLQDVWEFRESAAGTLIVRSFVVDARAPALPLALVLVPLLRKAVQRDLRNTKAALGDSR